MQCLVFCDVVDSTLFVQRVGAAEAARVWAEHDRRARLLCRSRRGREIDRADGFFLLFDVAADAARYALDYHALLADLGLAARIGIHVGEVTLREAAAAEVAEGAKPIEVDGLAKPFAARLMSLARPGQTLLSDAARGALGELTVQDISIEPCGSYRLKGIDDPVAIYALGPRTAGVFAPPDDTEKAYRVVRVDDGWQPLHEVRHNLPAERDAFVGRRVELQELARRIRDSRVVTVVGAGGSGKTRLVRRFARTWRGDWPGGVYFCDLSEARTQDGICFSVASALGVRVTGKDPAVSLGHVIAGHGRCLLILDNFEQVSAFAPTTVGRWLERTALASFMVTSRERLRITGETLFPLDPLPLETDAVELFRVRAQAQRPDLPLNVDGTEAVKQIVQLVDGLPLAIELAAARVRVMSLPQMAERMRDRLRMLVGARGSDRQGTMKAAIDWSWNLLTPWEQSALAMCSVFEGDFTLLAAEAVVDLSQWPNAPPVADVIESLIDKSVLRISMRDVGGGSEVDEPHFAMYLSVNEYAAERLDALGADARRVAEERHGRHFAAFGQE